MIKKLLAEIKDLNVRYDQLPGTPRFLVFLAVTVPIVVLLHSSLPGAMIIGGAEAIVLTLMRWAHLTGKL